MPNAKLSTPTVNEVRGVKMIRAMVFPFVPMMSKNLDVSAGGVTEYVEVEPFGLCTAILTVRAAPVVVRDGIYANGIHIRRERGDQERPEEVAEQRVGSNFRRKPCRSHKQTGGSAYIGLKRNEYLTCATHRVRSSQIPPPRTA